MGSVGSKGSGFTPRAFCLWYDVTMDKDLERFYSMTHQAPSGCLEWTGSRKNTGYGRFWSDGKMRFAHRWLYQKLHDVVLGSDRVVMHSCDNPCCVNINHLSTGTNEDNLADMRKKGRARQGIETQFPAGVEHHDAKLDPDKVRAIRSSNETQVVLSRRYGVSTTTIRRIKQRKIWKSA